MKSENIGRRANGKNLRKNYRFLKFSALKRENQLTAARDVELLNVKLKRTRQQIDVQRAIMTVKKNHTNFARA